jgi:hypothetical protein
VFVACDWQCIDRIQSRADRRIPCGLDPQETQHPASRTTGVDSEFIQIMRHYKKEQAPRHKLQVSNIST